MKRTWNTTGMKCIKMNFNTLNLISLKMNVSTIANFVKQISRMQVNKEDTKRRNTDEFMSHIVTHVIQGTLSQLVLCDLQYH